MTSNVERAARPGAARYVPWVALTAVVAGMLLPPDGGLGPTCWIKRWTGLPCLSCGLTRSFLHTLHGDWAGAFQLHPLGPPLVAWCVLVAAAPLLPAALRRQSAGWLENPVQGIQRALPGIIILLILNGLYRLWWTAGLGRPSPW